MITVLFTEKRRSSEDISKWKDYTIKRLIAAYQTNLIETGLVRGEKEYGRMTPILLDKRLIQWLVDKNRKDIVLALGEFYNVIIDSRAFGKVE